MGPVLRALKETNTAITDFEMTPEYLAEILTLLEKQTLSNNSAKTVFDECLKTSKEPNVIVKERGLVQITDSSELESAVENVLAKFPDDVQAYLNGKDKVLGFLMGQIMRATSGKGNPKQINQILREKLSQIK